ncbi:MAG: hypothetical protein QOH70_2377 [Blastocatellia bacterium]|jgi:uncharacterized membrane protein|nr:hypothetical protein [Blastocatellia bacterium]
MHLKLKKTMKRFLWLSSLCIALLVFLPGRTFAQCSGERWPVKIGTDADASLVNLSSTTATTIAALSAISTPSPLPDNGRIQPTETRVWVLNVTLVKYARSFDSDYHMVFSDGAGHTMIAEIPSPGCVDPNSPFAAGIAHARAQFDAMFTATTTFQDANVPVQITGVGFFDYFEGQEGIAPNGIELHPVIDIIFGPNFSLLSSASSLTIPQSGAASSTITSNLSGNFNSSISLSASGLPAGATASFSPAAIAAPGSGSSTLTIAVGATTPVGTYNVAVNGSGGGQSHSVTINLTVSTGGGTTQQLLSNPGFENGSGNPAPWTVSAGVIDNSSFEAPHTGSWKAWLNGYGSAHTDTLLQTVSIPSTATSAALSFWRHIDTAETTTTKTNDTMKVQVRNSSGLVLATLATYSNLNAAAGYTQVSFDLIAYKGQTIQIYLVGTENSNLKTSFVVDDFALNAATSGGTTADFTIASALSSLAVTAGGSGATNITTTISGSFNSVVSLSASGLPAGAAASFSPASIAAPGSGSATLTIAAAASTAPGTYSVVVNGAGGGKTHSATINLTVGAAAAADFTIASAPSSLAVTAGSSGATTITTTVSGSFNSAVSLSASGLPAGATASFSLTSIPAPGSGSATLTIAAAASTAAGVYSVVVNGAGGGKTHSATITLTVSAAGGGTTLQLLGNAGFENGSSNPSPWTVSAGVIDNSSFQAPHGGSWKAWLNGYGSVHTDTLLQQVTIAATATGANVSFWRHIDTAETTTTTAYDTLKVQVRNSAGTVLATLATYSNLNAGAGYTQISFDLSAYKGQTIQIYLVGTEDSSLKTSFVVDDFLLNVTTP